MKRVLKETVRKLTALILAAAVTVSFMPAAFAQAESAAPSQAAGEENAAAAGKLPAGGKAAESRFRIRLSEDEEGESGYTLDELKEFLKDYVDESFFEAAVDGEDAYCKAVWDEITALLESTRAYIDSAQSEDELFTTDGFFMYPAETVEANISVLESLCEMNLHYVKDKESGIAFMKKQMKEDLDSYRSMFAEGKYNDFYSARIEDLFTDIEARRQNAKTFEECVRIMSSIEADIVNNLPMMSDWTVLFDDEDTESGFKYLFTEDEVESQREAVANRINCYIDIQLKESGYSGDTKKLKEEAKKLIASLKGLEIVEDIWDAADRWLAAKEKQTGVVYETLGTGDRLRALRELRRLSYQYTQTDYSSLSWMEVEDVFLDAYTIISEAEKKAEIKNVISDAKKKLAKIPDYRKELAKLKKDAVKDLKQYTNAKKYRAKGVRTAKAAIRKIKASSDIDEIGSIWESCEKSCRKQIKKFRIATAKKGPGRVTKSKTVKYGGKCTIRLLPAAGKRIKKVYIDGKKKKLKNSYTFRNVKKKHTVKVVFGK